MHQAKPLKSGNLALKETAIPDNKVIKLQPKGTSGTDISGKRFVEEYLTTLLDTAGADIWDKMRRSDDQVAMLLRVVKNPIMSARWFISPVDEDEESKKIAEFVEYVLFNDMGTEENPKSFEKFKREALTSIEFGYSLFEITNKTVKDSEEWGSYIGLKGLDWRSPRTIEEWSVDRSGYLEWVRQIDNSENGGDFYIPGDFLLHIAPEMEGDNFEGISMLRPIYGNYLRKDLVRKLQMIGIERGATGIPIGEIPEGFINSAEQTALEEALSRFVNHERAYMTVPKGFGLTEMKISHDAEKVDLVIQSENKGMSKTFLANFMELGISGGGAYALATDLSDIFLSGIEVYSNAVRTSINQKLIPMLVKQNYGKQKAYPELKIEGINDKAGKEFAEVLKILNEIGLLEISERLQKVISEKYKLPKPEGEVKPAKQLPAPKPKPKTEPDPDDTNNGNQFTELKLSEKNVSGTISKSGKELTEKMREAMQPRAKELIDKIMIIWRNEPTSTRLSKANALKVPGKNDYKKLISEFLADVYVDSTNQVKKELSSDGLKLAEPEEIKDLPIESKAAGRSQAELLVASQDADLLKNVLFTFTSKADVLPTEQQMQSNLLAVVEKYLNSSSFNVSGPNAVSNAVNLARNAIFQQKETLDQIETFVFTNPSPEAPICKHLKGRVFTKSEYIVSNNLPPLHHNCNSYIVAQISGRKGNKKLDPRGLNLTGTELEVEKLLKSITL